MTRYFSKSVVATLLAVGLLCAAASAQEADKVSQAIDDFLSVVQKNDAIDTAKQDSVVKTVTQLRDDEYDRYVAITEGLCELYPDYAQALDGLGEDDPGPAFSALEKFAKSEDAFLAADASFFLARSYMLLEKYEQAMPLLENVTGDLSDKTGQAGNGMYLKGIAEARLLNRKEAIASLQKFIDENPAAPERMKIGAWRQLEYLKSFKEGQLADVYERMEFSRRHLALEQSGDETQEQQETIVAMLDNLIKEAEDKESKGEGEKSDCKKCEGQGCKECEGEGQSEGQGKNQSGQGSKNPNGVARRTYHDGPQSPWSQLRERERDPAYSAIKEKMPARFERLIEQYYKSFQDGAE